MKYLSLLILPALFVCAAIGCSGKPLSHPPAPASPDAGSAKSGSSHASDSVPNMMTTEGPGNIVYADPKTGKTLWKVNFNHAEFQAAVGSGQWHDVRGTMYSDGMPADDFSAPLVTADTKTNVLTATGGVIITSLTQADTKLTCDRMTLYSEQNKLIGVGHAVFKKGGITQTMPSFQADTRMRKIVTPAPGLGKQAGRSIHTRITHRPSAR